MKNILQLWCIWTGFRLKASVDQSSAAFLAAQSITFPFLLFPPTVLYLPGPPFFSILMFLILCVTSIVRLVLMMQMLATPLRVRLKYSCVQCTATCYDVGRQTVVPCFVNPMSSAFQESRAFYNINPFWCYCWAVTLMIWCCVPYLLNFGPSHLGAEVSCVIKAVVLR